jgi:hypothetical protein
VEKEAGVGGPLAASRRRFAEPGDHRCYSRVPFKWSIGSRLGSPNVDPFAEVGAGASGVAPPPPLLLLLLLVVVVALVVATPLPRLPPTHPGPTPNPHVHTHTHAAPSCTCARTCPWRTSSPRLGSSPA